MQTMSPGSETRNQVECSLDGSLSCPRQGPYLLLQPDDGRAADAMALALFFCRSCQLGSDLLQKHKRRVGAGGGEGVRACWM
eukprot:631652-Pelagomonas_calceolata.AAC.1